MRPDPLVARRESGSLDFKESFDPGQTADWCELLKDVVAMANSGGGHILVGVSNDGQVTDTESVERTLAVDPAVMVDKITTYTGVPFDGVSIEQGQRGLHRVAVITIRAADRPLVFERPGSYTPPEAKKEKVAFQRGTLYVRHGAKSEPATSADITRILEVMLERVRRDLLRDVRKVTYAPRGSVIEVLPPNATLENASIPVRVVTDSSITSEYRLVSPDVTHPHRGKELLGLVNKSLPSESQINSFHLLAIRRLYNIDEEVRYFHKSRWGSPQYSLQFANWLLEQHKKDPGFFAKAREEYRRRE